MKAEQKEKYPMPHSVKKLAYAISQCCVGNDQGDIFNALLWVFVRELNRIPEQPLRDGVILQTVRGLCWISEADDDEDFGLGKTRADA